MASSSFQNITIADYIRILFQRLWIIILCTVIAVIISGYFAIFNMQKRYQSSMDIRVVRKHSRNPFLKRLLTTESLNEVITDLRDRLQGEKRLLLLAKNLRLKIKNEYIKENHLPAYSINQKKAVESIIKNLDENDRLNIIVRMELVTMAKILGIIRPEEINPFEMINGNNTFENSEYLINENHEFFVKRMRKFVATEKEKANNLVDSITPEKIRQRAAVFIDSLLSAPNGIDKFEKKQLWEIHKELLSIERLLEVEIYDINISKEMQKGFIARLRGGLDVGVTRNNFMHLVFDVAHTSIREAVPHLVILTAYEMIRSEYYASEEGVRNDAKREMRKQIKRLNNEVYEINKKLANHENLIKLQMAYARSENNVRIENEINQDNYQLPRISTHIQNLNELAEQKRELEGEIEAKKASIKELEETLQDPSRVRIVQKTIKVEDSPATRRLEAEKAEKEAKLRKFRLDATEKHPSVQRLMQEIQQINLALSGLDSPIETTIEKEHPMVSQWKAQRIMHKEEIAVLKAKINEIEKSLEREMKKAVEAPKRLQKYESLQRRKSNLMGMLSRVQQDLEQVLSEENVGKGIMRTEFEVYRSPIKPLMHYAPRIEIIIAIGFLIGLVTALAAIFFIEYTDHSIKGIEDAKRFFDIPILGTIPEFEFQEAEESHIKRGILLRKIFGQKAGEINNTGQGVLDVITTKKSKYMRTVIMLMLAIILILGASYLYMESGGIMSYYYKVKHAIMERMDMEPAEKEKKIISEKSESEKEQPEKNLKEDKNINSSAEESENENGDKE